MKNEIKELTLKVVRFRSDDGKPTCCLNYLLGQTCRFLATRRLGTVEVCTLGVQRDIVRIGSDYLLRPDEDCEVWG